MKRVVVCGAGGFIGSHLVEFLDKAGYWIRGVDLKYPEWSKTKADEFIVADLRIPYNCRLVTEGMDEVYQLAADMGGMGFISQEHIASLHNSDLINVFMAEACAKSQVKKVFFSSSACVYPTHKQSKLDSTPLKEEDVFPAMPNEAYGWEKLMAELRYLAYQEKGKYKVRIARFGNTYGERGTYKGGREKAPAAFCRKVAEAKDGGKIEVWGDGKAQRAYLYIDDLIEGIFALMNSNYNQPVNLGSDEVISVNELAKMIIDISCKRLTIKNVSGPEGIRSRFIDHSKAKEILGWSPTRDYNRGLTNTYRWIEQQVISKK